MSNVGKEIDASTAKMVELASRQEGATIEELAALAGGREQTVRSRLAKLRAKGYEINRDLDGARFFIASYQ